MMPFPTYWLYRLDRALFLDRSLVYAGEHARKAERRRCGPQDACQPSVMMHDCHELRMHPLAREHRIPDTEPLRWHPTAA
jgi:hypothetical protein